jgi:uncharacterized protein (TIGR01244 family)
MLEYHVSDCVVLAGQSEPETWAELAACGFSTVINIRSDPARAATQAKKAEAAGLHYIHLPVPAYELESEHLAAFNKVISRVNHGKVFLYCRTASRTALLWMLKRIVYDGWTQAEAEAELRAAGYDEESMDTFSFCAEDFFERALNPELILA